jgi:hypothetical protein
MTFFRRPGHDAGGMKAFGHDRTGRWQSGRTMRISRLVGLGAILIAATAPATRAQTAATLAGVVLDATGAALAGAEVAATHLETATARRTTTAPDGRFTLAGLAPGDYELRVERPGFQPLVRRGLRLAIGDQPSLVLTLDVGAAETVTVTAGAAQLNTRTAELGYLVGSRSIEQIPINGRNLTDLMALQPAVSPFPHRDNGSVVAHGLAMSVNGQDPRANVYLLDGTLLNDFTNGPAGSAAGTALGMDTVREFRVESNVYSARYGRAVGGQINVITRSGANQTTGTLFEFHRNDALDARNYFDAGAEPAFRRNQFGGTIGGALRRDRLFLFAGYEALLEHLGRTIVTTVPDDEARQGRLPGGVAIAVDPAVVPYLQAFPVANGEALGGGLARHTFPFAQELDQHFGQARIDARVSGAEIFVRYTIDDADQRLPTDYPQFPRAFVSTNQFLTAEARQVLSPGMLHTARFGFSRTRIGQTVETTTATPLPVFVPGRTSMGAIDIGGLPRFGPQSSADVRLRQDVVSLQYDLTHARGRHLTEIGGIVERYSNNERNPTFSLGIFRFANLAAFLRNQPASFIGLTPAGDFTREWDWTLFAGYVQHEFRAARDLTTNAGLRFEGATLPRDRGGRDINMPDLLAAAPTVGPLYRNPAPTWSPRLGLAWNIGGRGRASLRGGYGIYYNTSNQQNLVVTVTNPPATPRVVIANPTFPVPPFERAGGISVRPIQFDVALPRVQMWNVNLQLAFGPDWIATIGYAGSRGERLWRNSDLNVAAPTTLEDGTLFYPAGLTRPNRAFSAIEVKTSDGNSWYRALIVDVRKHWHAGWQLQSSYTWSTSEDTTQNSTFFSDSTTATTSAMPEFIPDYNKGFSDFHAEHHWIVTGVWELPKPSAARAVLRGWRIAGVLRMRSGNPLTPFVQTNRSRSLWSPSLGPGTGPDRPSYAPGRGPDNAVRGRPEQWFDPTAFVLPPAGTFGTVGRNELIGPDLRTVDVAVSRRFAWPGGGRSAIDVRLEVFNVFNRANFGPPSLIAFAGMADGESVLPAFGQIRTTVTAARQAQIGVRFLFQ